MPRKRKCLHIKHFPLKNSDRVNPEIVSFIVLLYVIRNGFLKTTAGREERRDENEEQSMEETRSEQHRRGETLE